MNNYLVRVEYAYEHEILNRIKEMGAEVSEGQFRSDSAKYFHVKIDIPIEYPEITPIFSPRMLEVTLKQTEVYISKLKKCGTQQQVVV